FQGELPFAAVADPEKNLYAEFGADRKMSATAALNPRTWWMACGALAQGFRFNRLHGAKGKGENHSGLPAEFLISPAGRVVAAKYGKRLDDHWSVEELLNLSRNYSRGHPRQESHSLDGGRVTAALILTAPSYRRWHACLKRRP
ncbi:MAG: hypothetical protein OK474_00880, partial [Thaumarchaeota archaeon]|nr:hypothetical protein [Nitrososphaerota archaeon]